MTNGRKAALQTYHAIQASDLAGAFNEALKKVRIGPGDYYAELTVPEGPSTAGGVQALQHVRLVSSDASVPAIVIGHANHADGRAVLRAFSEVDTMYRERFRRPLVLDAAQYGQMLGLAKQMLEILRLQTVITGLASEPGDFVSVPPSPRRLSRPLVAGLVGMLFLLLGIGLWALLRTA